MKVAAPSPTESLETLSEEVVQLRAQVADYERDMVEHKQTLHAREHRIEQLLDYIQLLRQKRFGASSERASRNQINLFDEAELRSVASPTKHLSRRWASGD